MRNQDSLSVYTIVGAPGPAAPPRTETRSYPSDTLHLLFANEESPATTRTLVSTVGIVAVVASTRRGMILCVQSRSLCAEHVQVAGKYEESGVIITLERSPSRDLVTLVSYGKIFYGVRH
jgi:hypothetical protein